MKSKIVLIWSLAVAFVLLTAAVALTEVIRLKDPYTIHIGKSESRREVVWTGEECRIVDDHTTFCVTADEPSKAQLLRALTEEVIEHEKDE